MARRRKKDPPSGKNLFLFLAVGMLLVLVLDHLLAPAPRPRPNVVPARHASDERPFSPPAAPVEPAAFHPAPDPAPPAISPQAGTPLIDPSVKVPSRPGPSRPAWEVYATPDRIPPDTPRIAVIIDDVGIDRKRSIEAIALPAPVTLAFLPYAHRVDSLASLARQSGHELLVHMPMEPMDQDIDTGQGVLTSTMDLKQFEETLEKNLGALHEYVGINNHMGSRLTADAQAMNRLMTALRNRGLAFVDSRTSAQSVAARVARAHGLPWAERQIFLDHTPGIDNVRQSLAALEDIARRKGQAIAIGHPKDDTLAALRTWIPTLEDKGFALVPVTAVLQPPETEGLHDAGFSPSAPPH